MEEPSIEKSMQPSLDAVEAVVRRALSHTVRRPLVVGLCGAQGSGKSTLAAALANSLERAGIATAVLSIDDLYRTRSEREELARRVHPLFITRGVPGTHDIALGLHVIEALEQGRDVALPRFDKAHDERAPPADWGEAGAATQVLLLEGWCIGALPQDETELASPINRLERDEDPQGLWRGHANAALTGEYQHLFARIDLLILLAAPDFDTVLGWRTEQEHELRRTAPPEAPGIMSDAALARFVEHYERLTRHILTEMPARADLVIALDADRRVRKIMKKS